MQNHRQSCAGSQREGPWVKGWSLLLSSDSLTCKGVLVFEFTFCLRQHIHHMQQHSNYTHNSSCCKHCNRVKFHHMEISFDIDINKTSARCAWQIEPMVKLEFKNCPIPPLSALRLHCKLWDYKNWFQRFGAMKAFFTQDNTSNHHAFIQRICLKSR